MFMPTAKINRTIRSEQRRPARQPGQAWWTRFESRTAQHAKAYKTNLAGQIPIFHCLVSSKYH